MKEGILTALGLAGGFIASLFGGWDSALTTLIIFMAVDYVTGLIVAGVFKRSGKTANGALESGAGFKGLCKKGMMLLIVLIACRLDIAIGTTFVCDAAVIAFTVNEAISIIEMPDLWAFPFPALLLKRLRY